MKEEILKILEKYNENLEGYSYFGKSMGVSEDNFEEVADDIINKYNKFAEIDNKQIFDLERQLFNSETHYEILKENYDLVFKWVAEMKGCSEEIAFDSFKGWLLQEDIK